MILYFVKDYCIDFDLLKLQNLILFFLKVHIYDFVFF